MSRGWGPVVWMTGTSTAAWAALTVVAAGPINPELWLGMIGPLAGADASWLVMARASASGHERLMKVLVRLLGVKMVAFAVYAVVVVRMMGARPVLFVVSFAGFFIALHAMEALFLSRLVQQGTRQPHG